MDDQIYGELRIAVAAGNEEHARRWLAECCRDLGEAERAALLDRFMGREVKSAPAKEMKRRGRPPKKRVEEEKKMDAEEVVSLGDDAGES